MNAKTEVVLLRGASDGGWAASGLAISRSDLDAIVREAVCRVLNAKAVLDRACPASKGRCSDGAKDNVKLGNRDAKAVEQRESEEEKIKRIAKQVAAEEVRGLNDKIDRGLREADDKIEHVRRTTKRR